MRNTWTQSACATAALTNAIRFAWWLIRADEAAFRLATRIEGVPANIQPLRHWIARGLLGCGRRTTRLGEAIEARIEVVARALRIDFEDALFILTQRAAADRTARI